MKSFLADENFPKASVLLQRDAGHNVIWVSSDFPSVKDEAIVEFARGGNRIILTFDRDYGELVFRQGLTVPGVIFFRIREFTPGEPARILLSYLATSEDVFDLRFSVVTRDGVRQRLL